mmetsp:Transcript_54448/g.108072  ORF Transcript_54448/g.108072 Transcript_54448/m.108072 type:complete len:262 (+) Transcript_54448:494-1279(+)
MSLSDLTASSTHALSALKRSEACFSAAPQPPPLLSARSTTPRSLRRASDANFKACPFCSTAIKAVSLLFLSASDAFPSTSPSFSKATCMNALSLCTSSGATKARESGSISMARSMNSLSANKSGGASASSADPNRSTWPRAVALSRARGSRSCDREINPLSSLLASHANWLKTLPATFRSAPNKNAEHTKSSTLSGRACSRSDTHRMQEQRSFATWASFSQCGHLAFPSASRMMFPSASKPFGQWTVEEAPPIDDAFSSTT